MSVYFTLTVHNVTAESNAGLPRLHVEGFWKYEGSEQAKVIAGVANLTLGNTQFPPVPFTAHEFFPGDLSQQGQQDQFRVNFWPDAEVLRQIERSKNDPTVDLNIQLLFAVLVKRPNGQQLEDGYGQMATAHVIKTAPWAAILKAFGLGGRWQATVVVPEGPLGASFAQLEPEVKQAFEHWSNGLYPEALVSCRKALEKLWDAIGDTSGGAKDWPRDGKFSAAVIAKLDSAHPSAPTTDLFSAKMYRQVESLFKFVHTGAHPGYAISRATAELVYSNTVLILQALSESLS